MSVRNPSAFPSPGVVMQNGTQQGAYEGMTLRDYFAGQFLTGIANRTTATIMVESDPSAVWRTVQLAYAIADAMLAERAKNNG